MITLDHPYLRRSRSWGSWMVSERKLMSRERRKSSRNEHEILIKIRKWKIHLKKDIYFLKHGWGNPTLTQRRNHRPQEGRPNLPPQISTRQRSSWSLQGYRGQGGSRQPFIIIGKVRALGWRLFRGHLQATRPCPCQAIPSASVEGREGFEAVLIKFRERPLEIGSDCASSWTNKKRSRLESAHHWSWRITPSRSPRTRETSSRISSRPYDIALYRKTINVQYKNLISHSLSLIILCNNKPSLRVLKKNKKNWPKCSIDKVSSVMKYNKGNTTFIWKITQI